MGDPIMDDVQILDPLSDRDDRGGNRKKDKKDKDKDDNKDSNKGSRTIYEGCVVERLKPLPGETISWRKCGRRPLPYTQEELIRLVRKHRKVANIVSADADFKRLGSDKQGIINRMIEEKKLYEKSKTAEWTLVDVQSIERRVGWSKEIIRLQIVIKRVDKGSDKNSYAANGTNSYPQEDVIDLSKPLEKKKDKTKDKKKSKDRQDYDPLDDPFNIGFGSNDLPRDDRRNHQPIDPYWDNGPNHPPPPAPVAPDWQQQNPFNPHGHPMDHHNNFAGGAREFSNPNPFYPQHHVAAPGQFDEPLDAREYIHPHHGGGDRARTRSADRDRHRERSRSRRRHSASRRPSHRRRDSRRRSDSVEDLRHKVDRMYRDDRDSSSSNYDEHSMWSRSDGRYDRSPDTSVYSDDWVPRNRSKPYRDSGARPRYRSVKYRDTEIEPAYTYGHRDRRHSYREHDRRPPLQHAITYDDYPPGRGAEPRYLPAPPQRRNTTAEVFGDQRADYYDRRDYRDFRQPIDREQDAFEAGIRAAEGRRMYYP